MNASSKTVSDVLYVLTRVNYVLCDCAVISAYVSSDVILVVD